MFAPNKGGQEPRSRTLGSCSSNGISVYAYHISCLEYDKNALLPENRLFKLSQVALAVLFCKSQFLPVSNRVSQGL